MLNLDYGIIGNCKSAALVTERGSIEWLCLPVFDSASVFAKILDKNRGGSFEIETNEDYQHTQRYLPKTNILLTKFTNGKDTGKMDGSSNRNICQSSSRSLAASY